MNKPTARIDHWMVVGNSLIGAISKHNRQSDFKAPLQQTSALVALDVDNNHAETLNTIYELGTPYVHP